MNRTPQRGAGSVSWLRAPFPELLVLLAAAAVRFWRLDYHSFWFDEAVSLRWAASDPRYTWDVTLRLVEEKHPPVYYLLLHYWQALGGWLGLAQNEIWLRSLGSLLGVFTVLGLLLLVTRLSGRRVGLLAAALAAFSPVLVWYSQELRMFQPATAALVWSAYALLRAWTAPARGRRWLWWLAMLAAFTLANYSYLFSAFMLPAAGVTVAGLWVWEKLEIRRLEIRRLEDCEISANLQSPNLLISQSLNLRLLEALLALTLTGLLFLPLALNAWAANASEGAPGTAFMDFGANLLRQLQIFTLWRVDWPPALVNGALALFAFLVLAGLLLPRRSQSNAAAPDRQAAAPSQFTTHNSQFTIHNSSPPDRLFLWAWIATPLIIGNLLLARNATIFAEDRYFLFLAPFVLWALARGAVVGGGWLAAGERSGWRVGAAAGGAALLLLTLAFPRLWTPAMLREDWRAASTYVLDYQAASPGLPAAVVAHVDYIHLAPQWYLRRTATQAELPLYHPFGGPLSPEQTESVIAPPLLGIVDAGARTLWLLQSHLDGVDDARLVEGWLNQRYPLVTEQYPAGVKLSGYALYSRFDELPELAPGAAFPAAELAPGLELVACELITPAVSAADERMHPPSGWVHVRLWWRATGPIADDYIASVQMVGPEGVWGDRLYRTNETLRRWPTSTWAPGVLWRDEVDVNLNPVTPPGAYPIVVGLRDNQDQPLPVTVECGRVLISN
jgi:uncharacterized membrane protein